MPEPPMPTKWMRFTLCRTGELLADVRARACRVGPAESARAARQRGKARTREAAQQFGERLGLGLQLRERDARAAPGEERRVRGLLVAHEPGEREEDRRDTRRADLGDGDRAG